MRRWFLVCAVVFGSLAGVVANAQVVEGTDYQLLSPPQPTSHPDKIVVTEFFSYQCPHCFHFSPAIDAWETKLPPDVVFERIPVSFGRPEWASIGQAYYALMAMGKLDVKMDSAIFNAIHVQNIRLTDLSSITDWVVKQGINAKDFTSMYNSFAVKMDIDRAEKAAPAYGIDGVPTLIVDGKYRLLAPRNVPTELDMANHELQVVNLLIAKERAARGMPNPAMASTGAPVSDASKAAATKPVSRKKVHH